MSGSDLFTVLSILLAIVALLPSEQRKYVHLKFNSGHWWISGILLLYIHYLVSYNWWKGNFEWLGYLNKPGLPTSGAYAYLLSLGLITYIIYRLQYAYYASGKSKSIAELYNQLIYNKDYELLRKLIEKFHNPHADTYFEKLRSAYKRLVMKVYMI